MHVIIAGCGRVGALLATTLSREHDVVIIDRDPAAFRRLGEEFAGRALTGIVFDREVLEEAGIRQAQAFVAVTSGDNSNVVSARTARERYDVEQVVARIYDPDRAAIFERLGITTIASARWTAEEVLRVILPSGERIEGSLGLGEGNVALLTLTVPDGVSGIDAAALTRPGHAVLAAITHQGRTAVPAAGVLLQAGDLVHLAVERDDLDAVRAQVAALGEEQQR